MYERIKNKQDYEKVKRNYYYELFNNFNLHSVLLQKRPDKYFLCMYNIVCFHSSVANVLDCGVHDNRGREGECMILGRGVPHVGIVGEFIVSRLAKSRFSTVSSYQC